MPIGQRWPGESTSTGHGRDAGLCVARRFRLQRALVGEDSGRGTFSHRHSVLHDQNREKWTPAPTFRSPTSPTARRRTSSSIHPVRRGLLAFEYGYASAEPNTLTIWEAQFGDFVNGAQVVIDQFIASGEVKWAASTA